MRIWITRDDDWTLCLWREKPVLQDDGVWMNYNEEYCVIDNDTCFDSLSRPSKKRRACRDRGKHCF